MLTKEICCADAKQPKLNIKEDRKTIPVGKIFFNSIDAQNEKNNFIVYIT